jgi:twitching motility protein PilT
VRLTPREADIAAGSDLEAILQRGIGRDASDVLFVAGEPPVLRLSGHLVRMEWAPLTGEVIAGLFERHLTPPLRATLAETGAVDLSLRLSAGAGEGLPRRLRVNLHYQRGQFAASLRILPARIPTLSSLNLPPGLAELVRTHRGLVLVCGPTGAGKSSTLAALVGEINRTRSAHVITIEDPIEYEYPSGKALIEQVEVGSDTSSFAVALRACLRQDPDVVLVGEMRDLETMATALTAAETGHLILATLHTHDVAQAIHRIVDVFPGHQQPYIRHQLALSLNAIVCQQLVPRADGGGRLPAVEILTSNFAVRNHIRKGALQNLSTEITLGRRHGMVSLEESLVALVRRGHIDLEEARLRSGRPEEFESLLGG